MEQNLIVGLGNPGSEYAGTRHNVGFTVIDSLARRHSIPVTKRRFNAVYGEGEIAGKRVFLARPMTYMNLSGDAVAALARYYKFPPERITVILDDMNLPLGRLRLRMKGSAGGQNGLENILLRLGTDEVSRIRIGVGFAPRGDMVQHVLSRFKPEELPVIETACNTAADALECVIKEGFEMAMNRFNPLRDDQQP